MAAATLFLVGILGLLYAFWLRGELMRETVDDAGMLETSYLIRDGAYSFIKREAVHVAFVVLVLFFLLSVALDFSTRVSFLLGALLSMFAGCAGLDSATLANVRTAQHAARLNRAAALATAFNGGAVMGLCVSSFALIGASLILFLLPAPEAAKTLVGFGMGGSLVALFARLGGGIFTKAADIGADLSGKIEAGIPEDDARNPAVIADNVGDNVGDVAGMGADLFESFVGSMVGCAALAASIPLVDESIRTDLIMSPFIMGALGLLGSLVGIHKMGSVRELDPSEALKSCRQVASVVFLVLLAAYAVISDFTWYHWLASFAGTLCGGAIGLCAEYYTGARPVSSIIDGARRGGPATVVINGLAYGFQSTGPVFIAIMATMLVAGWCDGLFGIAVASVAMLATVGMTMAVDAFGPIADNAGGLVEMAGQGSDVRAITDELDALGNTTAALGKGFSIGSAALTSLTLFSAFVYSVGPSAREIPHETVMNPMFLIGTLLGAVMPCVVTGLTMLSVGRAAGRIVDEVRRQFREIPGLLEGRSGVRPEVGECVRIAAEAALSEMKLPTLLAVIAPIVAGIIGGRDGILGLLVGSTCVSFVLALIMANSGGAWDNAKKRVEQGLVSGESRGGELHRAAVVGDTVGDPLKDTAGPALNILMKLTALVALTLGPLLVG